MYTVAVTGITGKSGQYFLKRLLKEKAKLKDYEFILLCRNDKIASKNNKGYQLIEKALKDNDLNVKTYDIDLTNVEGLKTFFKEQYIDMLLHIAGIKLQKKYRKNRKLLESVFYRLLAWRLDILKIF